MRQPDIVQIGAVTDDGRTFDIYVNPSKPIESGASSVNGLYTDEAKSIYRLLPGGRKRYVQDVAQSQAAGLTEFFHWLKSIGNPVTLIAYNGNKFDFKVLSDVADRNGVKLGLSVNQYDPIKVCKILFIVDS